MKNPATGLKDLFVLCASFYLATAAWANDLSRTVAVVKPSIVGVGSYEITRNPQVKFFGTGFVVGDGLDIITNAHVANAAVTDEGELLGIIVRKGNETEFRPAKTVAVNAEHDLARLKIDGQPLPVMQLADSGTVVEGQSIAFTGFPLGIALGLNHVTHRGMVSAITPVVMPAANSNRLDPRVIAQLRKSPFTIFQLDGTAYPGNSGSPLYDPATGVVYGVINMVLLKGVKESAISTPSGITYAIPSNFVRDLLQQK